MRQLVEMNIGDQAGLSRLHLRDGAPPIVTTRAFDWPGLRLEAGMNNIVSVDEVSGMHHYVSMNLDDRPVTLEVKEQGVFRRVVLRRGTAWFVPAGDDVTVRVNSNFRYIRISIDPIYFSRLVGQADSAPIELHRNYCIAKSQIGHILDALVAEADAGNPGGLAFVEALATGLSHQITLHAAEPERVEKLRGGLTSAAKRRTLEIMEAHLGAHLTVELLAHEVGLSPAHFSRAFKETIGRAPHRYLLTMRLAKARRLLETPDVTLSEVAQRTGFSDQAHLTRLFKREFGTTPGSVLRGRLKASN